MMGLRAVHLVYDNSVEGTIDTLLSVRRCVYVGDVILSVHDTSMKVHTVFVANRIGVRVQSVVKAASRGI